MTNYLKLTSKIFLFLYLLFAFLLILFFSLFQFTPNLLSEKSHVPIHLVSQQNVPIPTPTVYTSVVPQQNEAISREGDDDFEISTLEMYMLDLVNSERESIGLNSVVWDAEAADIGRAHAQEMSANGYISHWNLDGYGPDVRFNLAGRYEWVMENVSIQVQSYSDGSPAEISDLKGAIDQAHEGLMKSPGHRDNVLSPDHTHVGIGIDYNPEMGQVSVAQEFTNQYIDLINNPEREASPGEKIDFVVRADTYQDVLVFNMLFEPLPQPMTLDDLTKTSTYSSPSEFFEFIQYVEDLDGAINFSVNLGNDKGIYHVMGWLEVGGVESQAFDYHIWVK
jgi:uncharacterized protein YkwD